MRNLELERVTNRFYMVSQPACLHTRKFHGIVGRAIGRTIGMKLDHDLCSTRRNFRQTWTAYERHKILCPTTTIVGGIGLKHVMRRTCLKPAEKLSRSVQTIPSSLEDMPRPRPNRFSLVLTSAPFSKSSSATSLWPF